MASKNTSKKKTPKRPTKPQFGKLNGVESMLTAAQWNLLAVVYDGASFGAPVLEDALAVKAFLMSIVGTPEFKRRLEAETAVKKKK